MIRIKRNPTDLSIINKLIIVKSKEKFNGAFSDDEILPKYTIYHDDNEIGYVFLKKNLKEVKQVFIYPQFQRKGVGSYVYNYIENDTGIKLKPSTDQSTKGKLFWKNRSKRKNPTDYELLKKVYIKRKKYSPNDSTEDLYQVIFNNDIIGQAIYDPISKTIESISVKNEYQRKGIATLLHDYIEKDRNIKLLPNSNQTWYGKAFWENRKRTKSN